MVMLTLKACSLQYVNRQFAKSALFRGIIVGRLGGWLVGLVVEGLGNPVFLSLLLLVGCLFVFVSFVVCFLV